MTAAQTDAAPSLVAGQRLRLPGDSAVVVVDLVAPRPDGIDLYLKDDEASDALRKVSLTAEQARSVRVLSEDGAAAPQTVIAGLWTEWMLGAVRSASSTVLASTPLRPLPHQMAAVYGQMITQPLLRFLLADEPGTGKTIEPPWFFWRVGLLVSNRLLVGSSGSVGRLELCRRDVAEMGV